MIVGVIPARYGSTRFEGKPLVMINGKSMIQRVYEQVSKCSVLTEVVVATDDDRIFNHVISLGGKAEMTKSTHKSGTERCYEVMVNKNWENQYGKDAILINIQGDEPFIQPEQIEKVSQCFSSPSVQIATLIKEIKTENELFSSSVVKVITDNSSKAIYFSRTPIPYIRNFAQNLWMQNHVFYKHIGIYAYRMETLRKIAQLKPSKLEQAESLEQLRWIENGFSIYTAITDFESIAIDTPEDLKNIPKHLL